MPLPFANGGTQFIGGFRDMCGPFAMSRALTPYIKRPATDQDVLDIRAWLLNRGVFTSGAGTTVSGITTYMREHGYSVTVIPFSYAFNTTAAKNVIDASVERSAMVIELSRGGKLPYNEPGVQFHFVAIVGKAENGYYIANGDDIAGAKAPLRMVTWQNLLDAGVCGLIVMPPLSVTTPPPPTTSSLSVPTGWRDNGTLLTAPNSIVVQHAYREMILADAAFNAANLPVATESYIPTYLRGDYPDFDVMQVFYHEVYLYSTTLKKFYTVQSGAFVLLLLNVYNTLAKQAQTTNDKHVEVLTAAQQFLALLEKDMNNGV